MEYRDGRTTDFRAGVYHDGLEHATNTHETEGRPLAAYTMVLAHPSLCISAALTSHVGD